MAKHRSRARHVGSDGDGPEAELVIRQQVAGERQQQREHQQDDADRPVELPRLLIRSGQKDAEHMELNRQHHRVRRPTVHVAQQLAVRDVGCQVENVAEGLHLRRVVVKHQQNAGPGQHPEQIEPMGIASRRMVVEKFDVHKVNAKMLDIIVL